MSGFFLALIGSLRGPSSKMCQWECQVSVIAKH